MTYALIDNATLTAVQRVMGHIMTRSRDSVDTDIVALENLLQAILLYDDIIAVDDYIEKHRDERINFFPYIRFLSKNQFDFGPIMENADRIASTIRPKIRGGEFANEEFKKLIELLQTHIICTWDVSSSIYYLTIKALAEQGGQEFKKYGNLAAAIFNEFTDVSDVGRRISANIELIDSYGNKITNGYNIPNARWGDGETGGITTALSAFVASLMWLANRTIFYTHTARNLQADTFLYPIRQAYQLGYLNKSWMYSFNYIKHIVEYFSTSINRDLVDIGGGGLVATTGLDLPLFCVWLAKETNDPVAIVNAALEIKNDNIFVEVRQQLRIVRNLFFNDRIANANKELRDIIQDIQKTSGRLRAKNGVQTRQGVPVTRLVHVYNTIAALTNIPKLPNYNFDIRLPDWLNGIRKDSGFSALYRNLTSDLSSVWSIGEYRDILGSRVVIDDNSPSYSPKNEEPRFRNYHSAYKSPM